MVKTFLAAALAALIVPVFASPLDGAPSKRPAADTSPEAPYYKIIQIPIPDDVVLECGGLEPLPDKKVAVGTRRGDIYVVDGIYDENPRRAKFTKWATGLHEILGLAYNKKDG